jgi:hypothetical protein
MNYKGDKMDEEEVIEQIEETVVPSTMETSESIGNLAGALAKAQGAIKTVQKSAEGYGYNYADLASVIEAIRQPLSENEVSYTQGHYITKVDGKVYVGTNSMLMHSSGEWIKSTLELPLPQMKQLQPAQLVGVVATYARRYLLQAQVGLAAEDTDGAVRAK